VRADANHNIIDPAAVDKLLYAKLCGVLAKDDVQVKDLQIAKAILDTYRRRINFFD